MSARPIRCASGLTTALIIKHFDMLAFYLNNKPFAVDSADSVRLTWRNPACNIKEFPGDIGLGIEIPVNDINRELLGNPERFERYAENNIREFTGFEIRYGGVLLMQGTLVINSASEEKYLAWLRSDIGNIGKENSSELIRELVQGVIGSVQDLFHRHNPAEPA